jgi:NADH:ubiquinone oxidoreductase subunit 2 (subunit N)
MSIALISSTSNLNIFFTFLNVFVRATRSSEHGWAVLIALFAAVPSVWLIQRRLSRLDLIGVLKTRE